MICDYIHVNPTICGLEYSDLFQEGCVWLCKAVATYEDDGRAQFATYAKTVVKNGLLSYCRKICNRGKMFSRLIIGEHGELAADGEASRIMTVWPGLELKPWRSNSRECGSRILRNSTRFRPPMWVHGSRARSPNCAATPAFWQACFEFVENHGLPAVKDL